MDVKLKKSLSVIKSLIKKPFLINFAKNKSEKFKNGKFKKFYI